MQKKMKEQKTTSNGKTGYTKKSASASAIRNCKAVGGRMVGGVCKGGVL